MDRNKLKSWIDLADMIFANNKHVYFCPNNDCDSVIFYEIKPYPKYGKMELVLKCPLCNISKTITKNL
jgi:hypothetical protein